MSTLHLFLDGTVWYNNMAMMIDTDNYIILVFGLHRAVKYLLTVSAFRSGQEVKPPEWFPCRIVYSTAL
jgi:hypothetical protein